jgi:hypothetical protein
MAGKKHSYILDKAYRWESWAALKDPDGKLLLTPQLFMQTDEQATGTAQRTVSLMVLRGFIVFKVLLVSMRATGSRYDELSNQIRHLESTCK